MKSSQVICSAGVFLGAMAVFQFARAGGAEAAEKQPEKPTAKGIAKDYAKLTLMTPKAVEVNRMFGYDCVPEPLPEEEKKKYGPHYGAMINVYMNKDAAEALAKAKVGKANYPVGAVVVKEKLLKGTIQALGGMIKREAGYDKDHGDWEFFFIEKGGKLESGKITNCVQCHNAVAEKDHVYGDWAPKPEK